MASAEKNCDDLGNVTEATRRRAMERSLVLQENTVLVQPRSIPEELACFGDFASYINIASYDPSAITDFLANFASKLIEKACNMAKNALNQQLYQITGAVNSESQLPYGMGQIYDFSLSTSGVSLDLEPQINQSAITSGVFNTINVNLPF